jgi:protein-S-isoprenylcysteine O-methyltransferase Ste14
MVGVILAIFQKLKAQDKEYLYYIGVVIVVMCLFILPFVDPLQMLGYLAAAFQPNASYSIFGAIAGFVAINIAIYAIWIFLTSIEYIFAERFKGKLITIKQYEKRRHPIFASYHIIGSSYYVIMGAPIGLIIFSIIMILLNYEAIRIEKDSLRKFGESFQAYKMKVPRRLYSMDILCLLIVNYSLLIIGIIGLVFFAEL